MSAESFFGGKNGLNKCSSKTRKPNAAVSQAQAQVQVTAQWCSSNWSPMPIVEGWT